MTIEQDAEAMKIDGRFRLLGRQAPAFHVVVKRSDPIKKIDFNRNVDTQKERDRYLVGECGQTA